MEKEFGKLTLDEFRQVVKNLRELRGEMKSLPELIKTKKAKFDEILNHGFCWAGLYELTFDELVTLLIYALGQTQKIVEISQSSNPQEAIAAWGQVGDLAESDLTLEMKHVMGIMAAIERNILSIMLFHRPLNTLVCETREGNDESFFNAVRVDRSILASPAFADRLAKAELANDQAFFLHLGRALKGPSKKQMEGLYDLRYAMAILRDCGFNNFSDAQLEELLVHNLKLYPNVSSAQKNLRKHYTESKKSSTT